MKNQLFYGDNLEVLRKFVADNSVDLIYIDPPFNSKRNYNQIYNNEGSEDKAQAQAFVDTWSWNRTSEIALREIHSNENGLLTRETIKLISGLVEILGKSSFLAYLVNITIRIVEMYRVLKDSGSFYLHCDPTMSHYLKLILDSIFGSQNFRNEIIWCYSGGGGSKNHFGNKHDTIFFYSKSKNYCFNSDSVRVSYTEGGGTFQALQSNKIMNKKIKDKVHQWKPNEAGKVPEDWWTIPFINPMSKERLGYPTQKPETLLERIIKASSNENDTILDAYCGCGTTIAVAEKFKRNWIGIDITYQSISLILKRLEDTFGRDFTKEFVDKETQEIIPASLILNGVPQDMESAIALAHKVDDRLRKEFEKWAILTYSNNRAIINEKKGADKGIDGIAFIMESNEKVREVILSVKSGNGNVSQIRDLRGVIERENSVMGILISLEEPTKPMLQEAEAAGIYVNPLTNQEFRKISIVTIEEMLKGARLTLPMNLEVLKSASRKKISEMYKLFE